MILAWEGNMFLLKFCIWMVLQQLDTFLNENGIIMSRKDLMERFHI